MTDKPYLKITKEEAWKKTIELLDCYEDDKRQAVIDLDLIDDGLTKDEFRTVYQKHHFGKIELKVLLDAIYGEDKDGRA